LRTAQGCGTQTLPNLAEIAKPRTFRRAIPQKLVPHPFTFFVKGAGFAIKKRD
jgi:hypothetical protein